jgi:hypothetical protein
MGDRKAIRKSDIAAYVITVHPVRYTPFGPNVRTLVKKEEIPVHPGGKIVIQKKGKTDVPVFVSITPVSY